MTKINRSLAIAAALSVVILAGCYSSGVDRNWGRAYRANFKHQIADTEAPATLDAPTGLDPASGEAAIRLHRERAETKKSDALPSVINIGSGIGSR